MSYGSPPPPSGGVNPYGDLPEETANGVPGYGTPPPAPQWPSTQDAPVEQYGTPPGPPPPPPPTGPSYGTPTGQQFGGPAQTYSPYTAAGQFPGSPGYGGWVGSTTDNGKGTGALVMGILSVLLCFGSLLGIGLGIGAIVMGNQGRKAAQGGTASNSGVATAGLVLGCIGVVLGLFASLAYVLPNT